MIILITLFKHAKNWKKLKGPLQLVADELQKIPTKDYSPE